AAARVLEPSGARGLRGAGHRLAAGHARRRVERLRDPGLHRGRGRSRAAARNARGETKMASLTPAAATAHAEPFFLVGSARSGTTLLRLMLAHHPRIECAPEFEFLVEASLDAGWPELDEYYEWLSTNRIFLPHGLVIDRELDYPSLMKSFVGQYCARS